MVRLSKEDLAQMNRDYFQSLEKEKLVEVADNLYLYAVEQWEKNNYYKGNCSCGHQSKSQPGEGITSIVEGRTRNLKLTEYVLVGSSLATLIASLGIRYRLSRAKISEFLFDWLGVELSIGTIDRCIREAGIACEPVVEELLAQLQVAEILHIDETPWYESGKLDWLWVAINSKTAVFRIAPRTKEEFKYLVTEAFVGWLITDGYGAYRHQKRRQRCLAHLIDWQLGLANQLTVELHALEH